MNLNNTVILERDIYNCFCGEYMYMEDIDAQVKSIIEKIYQKKHSEPLSLTDETSLRSIGFDSFDFAELTVKIEDIFEVDIFENRIVDTLGEIKEDIENGSE